MARKCRWCGEPDNGEGLEPVKVSRPCCDRTDIYVHRECLEITEHHIATEDKCMICKRSLRIAKIWVIGEKIFWVTSLGIFGTVLGDLILPRQTHFLIKGLVGTAGLSITLIGTFTGFMAWCMWEADVPDDPPRSRGTSEKTQ